MLYLVLILVITAFALLIAALTTAHTVWAWISVAISVLAAGLLVFDWLRGRRRVAAISAPRPGDEDLAAEDAVEDWEPAEPEQVEPKRVERVEPVEATTEIPPVEPVAEDLEDLQDLDEEVKAAEPEPGDAEPDEEATDATDLLIVSDLNVEVRVVDEHPRYHLTACTWLASKPTLPLPVAEARQLGFTPCARCGPDAVLAGKHRASRGAKQ